MLTHPTHDRLIALGLTGMAKALEDQRRQPDVATLPFEERLAMMIDREAIERENKRLERRLKAASLRQSAIVEDIDHKAPRGLDRAATTAPSSIIAYPGCSMRWRSLAVTAAMRGSSRTWHAPIC
jgi:DNA replication protein DnaC